MAFFIGRRHYTHDLDQLLRIIFLADLASIEVKDGLAKFGLKNSINTDENNNSVCKKEKKNLQVKLWRKQKNPDSDLQVNKTVLSFIKDILPSSLKHIFTLSQKVHGHNTRQINGAKTHTPWLRANALARWVLKHGTIYRMVSTCIYGAAFSFNEWDRVMGNTPGQQHQIYGINQ